MRKLRLFIKLVKNAPLLVKVMMANSVLIVIIAIVGLFSNWNDTFVLLFLNLVQVILFFRVDKQFKKKRELLKKLIDEFDNEIMTLLIVDERFKENVRKLIAFAKENPFTMDDLLDMYNGAKKYAGDTQGYSFITPSGIKIVHCIEQQVAGNVRYLSISVPVGELPNPYLVMEIMKEVGFENKLEDCILDIEGLDKDKNEAKAIAIREIIKNG